MALCLNVTMRRKFVIGVVAVLLIGVTTFTLNYFGTSFAIGKTCLKKGEKTEIEIRFLGQRIPYQLGRYKSSYPQSATVSRLGVVTAVDGASSTIILARFGLIYATFPILVNPKAGVPLPVNEGKLTVQIWERFIKNTDEGTVTVFYVAIENSSHIIGRREKIKIDPKYFTLIDEDGATFPVDLKIAGEEYQLPLRPAWLTPSNWAIGIIVFRGIEPYKGKLIYDDGHHKPVVVKFDHRGKKLSK